MSDAIHWSKAVWKLKNIEIGGTPVPLVVEQFHSDIRYAILFFKCLCVSGFPA